MEPTNRVETSVSNSFPDAKHVGEHLVIEKAEWVPGPDPDPHRRHDGQTQYLERYLRCILCGDEVLDERALPDECDGERQ